jgi:valyl-tRNA synthetase
MAVVRRTSNAVPKISAIGWRSRCSQPPVGEIFLAIAGTDTARERERLNKEIAKIETEVRAVEEKLANKSFIDRAPGAVVEEHRRRLADFTAKLAKLRQAREGLK